MAVLLKALNPDVMKFLLQKQFEFRMEKNRIVSMEKTIEKLLKDAYLKDKKMD